MNECLMSSNKMNWETPKKPKESAPFPSAIIVFKPTNEKLKVSTM